jgi:hypothetical protein
LWYNKTTTERKEMIRMTEIEMEKVQNIINIVQRNSITCQHCKFGYYCTFGFECLSNNFSYFKEDRNR